jgi:DNA polymerase elongation subunit (family B)
LLKTKAGVFKVKYTVENGKPIVHLYGRKTNGSRLDVECTGAEPWFCVYESPTPIVEASWAVKSKVKRIERWGRDLYGRKLWKVTTHLPSHVGSEHEGIRGYFRETYEADILFSKRVRVDYGIKFGVELPNGLSRIDISEVKPTTVEVEPNILTIDIEVDDKKGFPTPRLAEAKVLSVCLHSSYSPDLYTVIVVGKINREKLVECKKQEIDTRLVGTNYVCKLKVVSVQSERELFERMETTIGEIKPDIVTGWNATDMPFREGFDLSYLRSRSRKMNYDWIDESQYATVDLMLSYMRLNETMQFSSLADAAERTVGLSKIPRKKIHEMWEEDRERLVIYNMWDVFLSYAISIKLKLVQFHFDLAKSAGCELEDTFFETWLSEMVLMHLLHPEDIVLPTKQKKEKRKFEGAYVSEPVVGLFENVVVFDLSSEYPSILRTFNMSPETRTEDVTVADKCFKLPSGNLYFKKPKGLIPTIAEYVLIERNRLKTLRDKHSVDSREYKSYDEQQRVMKYITNAIYGVLASPHFRLADDKIAADVTDIGRRHVKWMRERIMELGYKPLYSDTDSTLVHIPGSSLDEVLEKAKDVQEILNQSFTDFVGQWGVHDHFLQVKVDKLYRKWFQAGTKKRYCGLVWWLPNKGDISSLSFADRLDVKGFEFRRRNVAPITKKVQKDVFEVALTGDVKSVAKLVKQYKEEIESGKLDEQLMIPATHNEIEANQAHYRAVLYSNRYLGTRILTGDDYKWVYVKSVAGKPQTDVVAVEWDDKLPEIVQIDLGRMVERTLVGPLNPILEGLGLDWQEIMTGLAKTTLDTWW